MIVVSFLLKDPCWQKLISQNFRNFVTRKSLSRQIFCIPSFAKFDKFWEFFSSWSFSELSIFPRMLSYISCFPIYHIKLSKLLSGHWKNACLSNYTSFFLRGQAWKVCQNKNGSIRRTVVDAIQNCNISRK